jgi:magnesium transporter
VLERWDSSPDLVAHGVDILLSGLLDAVVDGYVDVIQAFDDYHDLISERIFAEQSLDPLRERYWFAMRRAVFRFHRLVVPMREVCGSLVRREHSNVAEEIYPCFVDIYDHILGGIEDLDSSAKSRAPSWRPTLACGTTART